MNRAHTKQIEIFKGGFDESNPYENEINLFKVDQSFINEFFVVSDHILDEFFFG